jgi:NO-binding membrane sensor protein with MHYT domain
VSELRGYYRTGLVALSLVIAILASSAALDLTNRVTARLIPRNVSGLSAVGKD